ncbi:helix-turn-helix DNA binding domain [Arthrobacter phage Racecar]|nr:helix-turn-helix DNA binding domain protein [Arthrobacter phage Racecar]QFG12829.1 helix-turn-helix DNA binding domain protein [Arthrobacter phage Mimi]
MTTKRQLPTLSEDTVEQLQTLRKTDKTAFHAYVKALRVAGWPLRAIAEPLKVSTTAVNDWEKKYTPDTLLPPVEALPLVEPKERVNRSKVYVLTTEEETELASLTNQASTVRRYTDRNAPSREAARRLESMLHTYRERGVSLTKLAAACGVSRTAIAQRLKKWD